MDSTRHFERIVFGTEVFLDVDGQCYREKLIDISLKGALISKGPSVPVSGSRECQLVIPLSEDVSMFFKSQQVHVEKSRMGLEFVEADPDSLAHLRRLLELNTGDPEEIERELQLLIIKA
ncbi:MAG: PilZ domain-containing protein [Desulfuromonadales bacterium]